jgi:hypothetical protein
MVCVNVRSCAITLSNSALRRYSARLIYLYAKSRTCLISEASCSVRLEELGGEGFLVGDGWGSLGIGVGMGS